MRSTNEHDYPEGASYRELRLLEEVDSRSDLSQRSISDRLGIALGITNILVKSMVKKGYIRVARVGWRRWVYSLTPAGISRKVQLTVAYTERILRHYRRVTELLHQDLGALTLSADSRVAIYGTTELAELMFLVLQDLGITKIDVFDLEPSKQKFLAMPVQRLEDIESNNYVKILVSDPTNVESRRKELLDYGIDATRIVTFLQNAENVSDIEPV